MMISLVKGAYHMDELVKIKDIASEYNISARTLRYYEDMGLIKSTRIEDYAYRMYDEKAVSRLQKILTLRRLNISIRDIQRIFNTPGTEVVLEVLGKKVADIDDEVANLHELKGIVIDFIRQIEAMDLSIQDNVRLLYEKAKSLENSLVHNDYEGKSTQSNRFVELTESLKKLPDVRIYELPACKMVASQPGIFGDGKLEEFNTWFSKLPRPVFPKDYLTSDKEGKGFVWLYIYSEGMEVPASFELIDFPGGLYAVASGIDADTTDYANAHKAIYHFIEEKGCFEPDPSRTELGNVTTPPSAQKAMGYEQMDYWVPIKVK
jgi:DNA-binding transcriptional MerR regulator